MDEKTVGFFKRVIVFYVQHFLFNLVLFLFLMFFYALTKVPDFVVCLAIIPFWFMWYSYGQIQLIANAIQESEKKENAS